MNGAIEIRRATQQDCAALCQTHVSSIRGLCRSHYSDAEIDAWSGGRTPERYARHIAEKYVVVAQIGAEIVGFGTLDHKTGDIMQIYVRPDFASKGGAGRILKELLSEAKRQSLREVRCLSSLNAEGFYVHSGFHPGQKRKHRFQNGVEIHCISMSRMVGQNEQNRVPETD